MFNCRKNGFVERHFFASHNFKNFSSVIKFSFAIHIIKSKKNQNQSVY